MYTLMKKKIMIVEDVALNRELLIQLLEEDYELIAATDGAESLDLAARERPDLILMDLSIPVIDGWEVTRRLKADAALRHIPIIAVTAHATAGDEAKARASGCDAYLSKPIRKSLLFSTLKHFLGRDDRGYGLESS